MDAPGDCSPSRKVVSKMMSLSAMNLSKKSNQKNQQPKNKNGPLLVANGPLE
jgi:hypothetical protein